MGSQAWRVVDRWRACRPISCARPGVSRTFTIAAASSSAASGATSRPLRPVLDDLRQRANPRGDHWASARVGHLEGAALGAAQVWA